MARGLPGHGGTRVAETRHGTPLDHGIAGRRCPAYGRSAVWPALRVLGRVGWPILIGSIALFVLSMLTLVGLALTSGWRGPMRAPGRFAFERHRQVSMTLLRSGRAQPVDVTQAVVTTVTLVTFAGIFVGASLTLAPQNPLLLLFSVAGVIWPIWIFREMTECPRRFAGLNACWDFSPSRCYRDHGERGLWALSSVSALDRRGEWPCRSPCNRWARPCRYA